MLASGNEHQRQPRYSTGLRLSADKSGKLRCVQTSTHLNVAVCDAKSVAVVDCYDELLKEPASVCLWHTAQLRQVTGAAREA